MTQLSAAAAVAAAIIMTMLLKQSQWLRYADLLRTFEFE